jgi:3-dehydroquinate dehydratase type I
VEINYCLPVIADSIQQCRARIAEAEAAYHYFEIWLDYVNDPEDAGELSKELGERGIFLFRRLKLEPPRMSILARQALIAELAVQPVFLDFDCSTQRDDLEFYSGLAKRNSKLICSYHDYKSTPPSSELLQIIDSMRRFSPQIYKLACFCNSPEDALRLLELRIELNKQNIPAIILGMGEFGMATRIFGTIWGNKMIFAPRYRSQQTAPEQLTRAELEVVFEALQRKAAL